MRQSWWPRRRCVALAAVLAGAAALTATTAQAQPAMTCDAASFEKLGLPKTRIVSASAVKDDARAGPHCMLRGAVNERTGTDGKPYAIGFEMRLPERWNGRYFDQVNGGNDGAVVPAYGGLGGNQPDNALARGYAVLSSDSGHDGQANRDAGLVGGNLFGFDEQARLDYGYTANVTLTPLAKTIIQRYYGRRPEYSYMVGCSNGGRHALVGATRLAREFDGFLAGDPGFNLPKPRSSMPGTSRASAQADDDPQARVLARRYEASSPSEVLAAVRRARRRGGRHRRRARGVSEDVRRRQSSRASTDNAGHAWRRSRSLRSSARSAGRRTKSGRHLYASWPFDAGLGGTTGAAGSSRARFRASMGLPLIACSAPARSRRCSRRLQPSVAGTPQGLLGYLRGFDLDRDAPKIIATTSKTYPVSAMDFMAPTDWRKPKLAGGDGPRRPPARRRPQLRPGPARRALADRVLPARLRDPLRVHAAARRDRRRPRRRGGGRGGADPAPLHATASSSRSGTGPRCTSTPRFAAPARSGT